MTSPAELGRHITSVRDNVWRSVHNLFRRGSSDAYTSPIVARFYGGWCAAEPDGCERSPLFWVYGEAGALRESAGLERSHAAT